MAFAHADRVWETEPPSSLRDLDDVMLRVDAIADDGATIRAGTIVSLHAEGGRHVVELAAPEGAPVTTLRLASSSAVEP